MKVRPLRLPRAEASTPRRSCCLIDLGAPQAAIRLAVEQPHGVRLLPLGAILWISGRAGKISIHSVDGELTTFGAVAILTEVLGSSFQRINRNVLVNLAAVAEFRRRSHRGEGVVVLCDGRNLPVTRTYARDLRARFIEGDSVPRDRAHGAPREARSAASGD